MQVILLEKVTNLGQLGEVVKVKDGFARNYLIPHGKAKRATESNLAEFEKRRSELEKAQADALAQAQERAAKIDGLMVQITQKAGVDGKLFVQSPTSTSPMRSWRRASKCRRQRFACRRARSNRSAISSSRSRCTPI